MLLPIFSPHGKDTPNSLPSLTIQNEKQYTTRNNTKMLKISIILTAGRIKTIRLCGVGGIDISHYKFRKLNRDRLSLPIQDCKYAETAQRQNVERCQILYCPGSVKYIR